VSYGGLTNQMYGHTSAMTLAAALGAGLIIPPAVVRNGFDKVHSARPERNQLAYSYSAFSDLFDEATVTSYLQGTGRQLAGSRPGRRHRRSWAPRFPAALAEVRAGLAPPPAGRGVAARVLSPQLASGMAQHFNRLHHLDTSVFNEHHLRHAQLLFPEAASAASAASIRTVNLPRPLFAKGAELQDVVNGRQRRLLAGRLTSDRQCRAAHAGLQMKTQASDLAHS
jgi:hypothetical protein